MSLAIDSTIKLSGGGQLPRLGLGVYQSRGAECKDAVTAAIQAGYKHIDTAQGYHNEDRKSSFYFLSSRSFSLRSAADSIVVGKGIVNSGVPRSSLFITTKYMPAHQTPSVESIYSVLKKSPPLLCRDSSTGDSPYVDLFLLHAPWGGKEGRARNWTAMAQAQKEGWARDIGVSNFGVRHLAELPEPIPAANQIEVHPWCQQREIVDYCQQKGIAVIAYCPLVRVNKERMEHPTLAGIAKKHQVLPTQVLVRWSLQKGYAPLPKSTNPERIKQNADVYGFELDEEDMKGLDALDQGAKGAISWNPIESD